jgi:putative ABC transport system substrate-binding protein
METVTVGVINLAPVLEPIFDGFKERMIEQGYVEGESITYIYDGPVGDVAKLDAAAQALVDQDVDLILALSTPSSLATMRATQEIPIIFAPIADPLRAGLVSNLARPEANATGVQWGVSEPRRLEWLLTLAPDVQKIYLPYNPDDNAAVIILEDIQDTAAQLDVELILREARDEEAIAAAINNIPEEADALFLLPDSLFGFNRRWWSTIGLASGSILILC